MTPATPLERNDIISRWTGDCIVPGSETAADAALRLANAMDILDDVPADILNAAYKLARRTSGRGFAPDPGAVHDIAGPMMTERLIDMRIERQRIAALTPPTAPIERHALPGPAPTAADIAALASIGYVWDASGNAVRTTTPTRRTHTELLRMPTQADLQAIGDALDRTPWRERMTMTTADYAALGMVA